MYWDKIIISDKKNIYEQVKTAHTGYAKQDKVHQANLPVLEAVPFIASIIC
jgi:hypothetical protein